MQQPGVGVSSFPTPVIPNLPSPGAGLAQEIALAEQLIAMLERESARLVEADADGVLALLMDKARLVNGMCEQALARHRALGVAGFSEDESGMIAWTKRLKADSPSLVAWDGLLNLARQAKELNQTNGLLITRQMARNQHSLQALQNTVPSNNVYGPKGQPAAVAVSRPRAVS